MKIKELFSKDIDRQINPAVVVSKRDELTVNTEIDEYVFTPTITDNLYKYLNTLVNSKQDKTGIWINGFYGSGKSHFIKYIYYCLNKEFSQQAFNHFIQEVSNEKSSDVLSDATPSNIRLLQKKIEKINIDTIIFNIDAVSGQKDDKEKITKIFFNQFNAFRGYNSVNIALALLLEKHLDTHNLFEEFKSEIKSELKEDWSEKGHLLISIKQTKVLEIAKKLDPDLDFDSLSAKLKNPDDITISDHLIPEFVEYLQKKDDDYRLVFLIDEISQYIGTDTNLLLNLQTIVEELGSKCGNKIWLTTTAQQTIEDLVENTENKGEDFGKILGRFETRISLESQNTTYITQKRILDKNSDAIKALSDFYKKNKEHIENQFVFSHDLYKGFSGIDEFVLSYPFVPYQFKLISDVFSNFANLGYVIKEVKDNERSILGITHFTAKEFKDNELGKFVTFDSFFNEQMRNNITHHASRILDPALAIFDGENKFTRRVIYTLFMISNISDTKKLTFPPNMDNLILLLLDSADVNRLDLQNKIQEVLDELIRQTIIYKEDEQYNFYKEDEIDIAKQIYNQQISLEDRLSSFDEDIFKKIVKFDRKVSFGNNNFNLSLNIDDKEIYRSGDINVIISLYDNNSPAVKALNVAKSDIVCCVNDWFMKDDSLRKDFEQFVKTKKFIKLNYDSSVGTRKRAIEKFGDQNQKRIEDLRRRIESKFNDTSFISGQQVLSPSEINGNTPTNKFHNVIEKHLEEIYKKNKLVQGYATSNDALKNSANNTQILTDNSLTEAESQVESYINTFGDSITAEDVIKHFLKPPYGWKDISTLDVLIRLAKKNKRKFEWRSDPIDINSFALKAIKTSERSAIVIKPEETIGADEIKNVRAAFRDIFNKDLKEDSDQNFLTDEMKKNFQTMIEHYQPLRDDYSQYPWGKHFKDLTNMLNKMNGIRDTKALFEHIIKFKDSSKSVYDTCKELEDFISNQYNKYDAIAKFTLDNVSNFDALGDEDKNKAQILKEYFANDDFPSNKFPQINKIYQELSDSLNALVNELRQKALGLYEKIYKGLDSKASELKISEPGIYTAKEYKLNALKDGKNISNLRLAISEADNFKSKNLQAIIDCYNERKGENGKQTEVITGLSTVIENEEQLDDYINKLKERLLSKLKENKILIIK